MPRARSIRAPRTRAIWRSRAASRRRRAARLPRAGIASISAKNGQAAGSAPAPGKRRRRAASSRPVPTRAVCKATPWADNALKGPVIALRRHQSAPAGSGCFDEAQRDEGRRMRVTHIIAGALIAVALLCGTASAQTTLRIGLAEDPDVLDPTLARTFVGRIVFASLCDKLVDITPDLKIVPQLATEWQWVDDNKGLVLKLRQGVTFHDGEPMDAAAVKFSLERHLTMPGSNRKAEISAVKSVEIVDDHTVKLVLDKPFAPLLAQLSDRAGMIVSPKAAQAAGDKFGEHPVCAGPYKFAERVAQDRIVVDRFPNYWNKEAIHFDRIVFQPIVDA